MGQSNCKEEDAKELSKYIKEKMATVQKSHKLYVMLRDEIINSGCIDLSDLKDVYTILQDEISIYESKDGNYEVMDPYKLVSSDYFDEKMQDFLQMKRENPSEYAKIKKELKDLKPVEYSFEDLYIFSWYMKDHEIPFLELNKKIFCLENKLKEKIGYSEEVVDPFSPVLEKRRQVFGSLFKKSAKKSKTEKLYR